MNTNLNMTDEQFELFMREQRIHNETMRLNYQEQTEATRTYQRQVLEAIQKPHVEVSLRDHFAGQALAGILATPGLITPITTDVVAEQAYALADAMLAAGEEKEDE